MIAKSLKKLVRDRAQGCCEYCLSLEDFCPESFAIEHIVPQSKGGATVEDNLALSCQGCNNHKYVKTEAIDPVTHEIVRLFHPRRDRWQEHFTWNGDYSEIVGLTSIGRATIAVLKLNRKNLVNLRTVFYKAKIHPPRNYPIDDENC